LLYAIGGNIIWRGGGIPITNETYIKKVVLL
jgi:hypothetical protein